MTASLYAVSGLFAGRRSDQKASRLVYTSFLAIAGGAAIWGLLVLSVHLFLAPSAGLRFSAVNGSSSHVQEPPPVRLQEMCSEDEILNLGDPRPLVRLERNRLLLDQLQKLQAQLLRAGPLMDAAELAAGYNAVNIDLKKDGADPLFTRNSCWTKCASCWLQGYSMDAAELAAGNIDLKKDGWARLKEGCIRHGVPEHEDPSTASCGPKDAPLAMLHDLAQELRVPWANAWSLNVVYAQPVNVKRAGQSGPQDPHVDNLPLREGDHECAVSSSETSVLYLQVPKDMQGGGLTLFEAGADKPGKLVQIEQNMLVRFRGSTLHRVNEFTSQSMRVSITLEQYQLPPRLLPLVSDYKVRRLQY